MLQSISIHVCQVVSRWVCFAIVKGENVEIRHTICFVASAEIVVVGFDMLPIATEQKLMRNTCSLKVINKIQGKA